jgi:hypothetical protein
LEVVQSKNMGAFIYTFIVLEDHRELS